MKFPLTSSASSSVSAAAETMLTSSSGSSSGASALNAVAAALFQLVFSSRSLLLLPSSTATSSLSLTSAPILSPHLDVLTNGAPIELVFEPLPKAPALSPASQLQKPRKSERISMAAYIANEELNMSPFQNHQDCCSLHVRRQRPGGPLATYTQQHTLATQRTILRRLVLTALSQPWSTFHATLEKLAKRLRRNFLREDNVKIDIPLQGLNEREIQNLMRAVKEDLFYGLWRTWLVPRILVFPMILAAKNADVRYELLDMYVDECPWKQEDMDAGGWHGKYPLTRKDADNGIAVLALHLVPGVAQLVSVKPEDEAYITRVVKEQRRGWKSPNDVHGWLMVQRMEERGIYIDQDELNSYWKQMQ